MKSIARFASIFIFLLMAQPVWASTIQVTTQNDVFMDGSTCSLRDAIESFNNAPVLSGGCTNASADAFGTNDTILLPEGQYNLTLSGAPNDDNSSGDLDIEPTVVNPLLIQGADSNNPTATIIDAGMLSPRDRVLHIVGMFPVVSNTPVTLDGVTIQNGQAPDGTFGGNGGGVWVGVGGCLDLLNSVVRMNRAGDGNVAGSVSGGEGGGMSLANLDGSCGFNISNSLIENNQAGNGVPANNLFPGAGGRGGGISAIGDFTMDKTTIRNNRAGDGAVNSGFDTFDTFGGNGGHGGGLYLSLFDASATITRSTFNNNAAGDGGAADSTMTLGGGFGGTGGGLIFEAASGLSNFTLANNTFSENAAGNGGNSSLTPGGEGGSGGGIFFTPPIMSDDVIAILNNNTIFGNTAGLGGTGTVAGEDGDGGGLAFNFDLPSGSSVSIANTIFADNTVAGTGTGPNCSGIFFTDSGFNLEAGTDCMFTGPGGKQNANPMLGPLQDNGGPTFTHALLAGSEALDMGNNTAAPGSGFPACEPDDQRMISRPQGSACDIGAYEAQTSDLAVTKLVSSSQVSAGSTLQFTLTATNNGPDDADFVMVEDSLPAGTTLVSATPEQGTCLESVGTVICDLGTILSGVTVEILIEVIPNVDGTQTNTATVSFPGIDPDPSNNTASVDYIVAAGIVSGSGCKLQVDGSNAGGMTWILGCLLLSLSYVIRRRGFSE